MTTQNKQLTKADLNQFIGTEKWYRHWAARKILFTDGAKYVADTGGAYWLLDEIVFTQMNEKKVAAQSFQQWKLSVRPDHTATLTCENGNGKVIFTKQLEYTDFPLDEIKFYFTDNVILLPSEYQPHRRPALNRGWLSSSHSLFNRKPKRNNHEQQHIKRYHKTHPRTLGK